MEDRRGEERKGKNPVSTLLGKHTESVSFCNTTVSYNSLHHTGSINQDFSYHKKMPVHWQNTTPCFPDAKNHHYVQKGDKKLNSSLVNSLGFGTVYFLKGLILKAQAISHFFKLNLFFMALQTLYINICMIPTPFPKSNSSVFKVYF